MPSDTICRHLFISGLVQGVGFRASLQARAGALQLSGWVRNRRDGRVEVLVQGPEAAVQALVQWCHRGPSAAQVDGVEASARPVDPGLAALHCVCTA